MEEYIVIVDEVSNNVFWHKLNTKESNMEPEDLIKSLGFDYSYCLWTYTEKVPTLEEI